MKDASSREKMGIHKIDKSLREWVEMKECIGAG